MPCSGLSQRLLHLILSQKASASLPTGWKGVGGSLLASPASSAPSCRQQHAFRQGASRPAMPGLVPALGLCLNGSASFFSGLDHH